MIWLQRLGVGHIKNKYLFACDRHFSIHMKLEKKFKKNAVPDIHLPNVSEPSFEEVFSPNSIIELGNEDFLPVVAESPDISNNLMLLASGSPGRNRVI